MEYSLSSPWQISCKSHIKVAIVARAQQEHDIVSPSNSQTAFTLADILSIKQGDPTTTKHLCCRFNRSTSVPDTTGGSSCDQRINDIENIRLEHGRHTIVAT